MFSELTFDNRNFLCYWSRPQSQNFILEAWRKCGKNQGPWIKTLIHIVPTLTTKTKFGWLDSCYVGNNVPNV